MRSKGVRLRSKQKRFCDSFEISFRPAIETGGVGVIDPSCLFVDYSTETQLRSDAAHILHRVAGCLSQFPARARDFFTVRAFLFCARIVRALVDGFKHLECVVSIFLADEQFESTAAPCDMRPHAPGGIGLDDGVDTRCLKGALCQIRLQLAFERVNYN